MQGVDMKMPPAGLCTRVEYKRCRDGDTPEVRTKTEQTLAVRLQECWCPELSEPGGPEAAKYVDNLLSDADILHVWFPPLKDIDGDGVLDFDEILQAMSFDRVPGRLFLGVGEAAEDLSELLVAKGYATKEKRGR